MSDLNLKKIIEANESAESDKAQDGQPTNHFYAPSVMVARDVIANILEKFSKGGVTYSFSHDDLILKLVTYARNIQGLESQMQQQVAEILKMLKEEYKDTTGKALSIGEAETTDFDVVSNYTTNKLSLVTYTVVYELPEEKANDDKALEKADERGNIANIAPKYK